MKEEMEKRYPYHIRDVHISDPFILADPVSKKYYTYVQFVDRTRFPEVETGEPCFYVLESRDLVHWSKPKSLSVKVTFGLIPIIGLLRYIFGEENIICCPPSGPGEPIGDVSVSWRIHQRALLNL